MKYFLLISEYNKAVVAAETDESAAELAEFLFMEESVDIIELNQDAFQGEGIIIYTGEYNSCYENCGDCMDKDCFCNGCNLNYIEECPEFEKI